MVEPVHRWPVPCGGEPIRVFVGCSPDGADAESQAVLEYTLRKHASLPIELTWMIASREGFWSGWNMSGWATPFSCFRWSIPALCGFEGRALYVDSDTIVRADIAGLWNTEIEPGKVAVARDERRFCVSLWNCEAARRHMLPLAELKRADGHSRQSAYFMAHGGLVQRFAGHWNYLDSDSPAIGEAQIVHYTDLSRQPHMRHAAPRLAGEGRAHWYDGPQRQPRRDIVELFEREFAAAKAAGYTVDRYIPAERFGDFRKRSMVNYRVAG